MASDLADIVGDSAVVDDVQSILDCTVVTPGELEGLLVAQLEIKKKHVEIWFYGVMKKTRFVSILSKAGLSNSSFWSATPNIWPKISFNNNFILTIAI